MAGILGKLASLKCYRRCGSDFLGDLRAERHRMVTTDVA
jgi:hypothetical protein